LPEGIDAYAINLEFNLGGNAQKVIGDMVSSLTKIEQKLGDVAKQFSSMKFSGAIEKGATAATKQLRDVNVVIDELNKKLSSINYASNEKDINKIRALQEDNLKVGQLLKEAEEAGAQAVADKKKKLEDLDKELSRGYDIQKDINKLAEQLPKEQQKSEDEAINLGRLHRQIRKFEIESGIKLADAVKKGSISKFKRYTMEKNQIEQLIYLLEEQEKAARKAGEKAQADHLAKLREVAEKTDEIKQKWEKFKGAMSKVGGAISGVASKIGLGELANAASDRKSVV